MSNQSDNKFQVQSWRLWLVYGAIAFVVITIIVRLVSLQIFSGQEWLDQAVENYVAEVSVPAQRGAWQEYHSRAGDTAAFEQELASQAGVAYLHLLQGSPSRRPGHPFEEDLFAGINIQLGLGR